MLIQRLARSAPYPSNKKLGEEPMLPLNQSRLPCITSFLVETLAESFGEVNNPFCYFVCRTMRFGLMT